MKKLTQEKFIEKANKIHNYKYSYHNIVYINNKTKISITCSIHGNFEQRAGNHLNGSGCSRCEKGSDKDSIESFIQKARYIHGEKLDYSKSSYLGSLVKIEIICPIHGSFWQKPSEHLFSSGCPKCSFKLNAENRSLGLQGFIQKANLVHNNKYDYSKIKYRNSRTNIEITCKKHGSFWQLPSNHLRGTGCPSCENSKGEIQIYEWLMLNSFEFKEQYKFEDCKHIDLLRFDFFLPKLKICIEFDGIQHFGPFSFNSDKSIETKNKNYKLVQIRDQIKNQYCIDNNIKLIRIPYWKIKNIENILEKELHTDAKVS